ncbi:hypothetical protein RB595_006304 [Gaeumannomyces hyphopodioides]
MVSASVLHGPYDLRLEQRAIKDPGVGELQVRLRSTRICGSDVSYYRKFANGDLRARMPPSLGHESSGVVAAVGPQVQGFAVGDRVALEVGVPCGRCGICTRGRYNLCGEMRFRSSAKSFPHFQGTLQERINHPAQWCHKLPDNVSFDSAALLEPLAVAIHAVNRARPEPGSTALVIGAGTVGLLTAAMAQQSSCSEVTITDIDAGRVSYALSRGFATHGHALAADILSRTAPSPAAEGHAGGVDVAFECTGKEACMHTALYAARPGGRVVMVGMGTPVQTLPVSVAHLREVDVLGVFRYANAYPTGIRLLRAAAAAAEFESQGGEEEKEEKEEETGRRRVGPGGVFRLPRLDDMVTHRFRGLEKAKDAFELAGRTADDQGNLVIKVIIEA